MTNSSFFPSSNFAEWSQLDRTDDHTPARRTATGKIEGRADLFAGGEGRIWSTAFWPSNREAHATGRWVALGTEGRRVQVAPFFRPFSHLLTQRWDAALAPGQRAPKGRGLVDRRPAAARVEPRPPGGWQAWLCLDLPRVLV